MTAVARDIPAGAHVEDLKIAAEKVGDGHCAEHVFAVTVASFEVTVPPPL